MNFLIKEIPKLERPRERLKNSGAKNLSNEELLAIILRSGTKNISVKEVAMNVLKEIKNISDLPKYSINKLTKIKGIGEVKAITLIATIELGKRIYLDNKPDNNITLNNVGLVYELFKNKFKNTYQEEFMVVYLDTKKKLIDYKVLFIGTVNESVVHPREIFKEAYQLSASYIICLHNHPSGDPSPSKSDDILTEYLLNTSKIMLIPLLDHIIIGENSYYSYLEEGKIK